MSGKAEASGQEPSNLRALLIGVDHYLPNRTLGAPCYGSLAGAVNDVRRVEALLRRRFGVEESSIRCLTATASSDGEVVEPAKGRPTYENMVAALRKLRESSSPGGQILIHFSGHGGRTPTLAPGIKGTEAFDECLVPYDIGQPQARYLRDLEIAHLLRGMVEGGAFVTLILDCCHSGGATRSSSVMEGVAARGTGVVDHSERPASSVVASPRDFASGGAAGVDPLRGTALVRTWSLCPTGYVLLAACRPQELAFEANFDGQRGGALTYWFLESLHGGGRLTYKQVHDRLLGRIHSRFPTQTPQIEGEAERLLFGREMTPAVYGVNVLAAEEEEGEGWLRLNVGQVHGVRGGARLAIHRGDDPDLNHLVQRLAVVELTELGAVASVGRIRHRPCPGRAPRVGDQGVLLASGGLRVRRPVRWVDPLGLDGLQPAEVTRACEELQRALAACADGFLDGEQSEESAETLWVTLNERGGYEICDASGSPLPNLSPELLATRPGAAERTVARLEHLAKYRNIQQLENFNLDARLRGGLTLKLGRLREGFRPGDRIEPQPFQSQGKPPMSSVGDLLCLTITNASLWTLNITALDLQPNWAVEQLYPSPRRGPFEPLDSESALHVPLRAELPPGCEVGTDQLKVFATLGPTSFRFLELPPLGLPPTRGVADRGAPTNDLERLLATLAIDPIPLRGTRLTDRPSAEWTVEQIEVRVRRK